VPQPVADLVYDMLAKTPDGRPASMRVVADRAEMLRDALAMGSALSGALPGAPIGVTRADLPSARTSLLGQGPGRDGSGPLGPPGPPGRPGARGRRRLAVAGGTLALCGLAIAGGLYISGHLATRNTGDNGHNSTAQHLSPSPTAPSPTAAQSTTPSPQPSSLGPEQTTTAPSPTASPRPTKTIKPTPSVKVSPSTSPSPSVSPSPSPTPTPTDSATPTPTVTQAPAQ
jgi:eukaryotic-like serine/threonine-protein kinase